MPPGWTGKLWAQQQGVELAETMPLKPDYLLFTDADIVYEPNVLTASLPAPKPTVSFSPR